MAGHFYIANGFWQCITAYLIQLNLIIHVSNKINWLTEEIFFSHWFISNLQIQLSRKEEMGEEMARKIILIQALPEIWLWLWRRYWLWGQLILPPKSRVKTFQWSIHHSSKYGPISTMSSSFTHTHTHARMHTLLRWYKSFTLPKENKSPFLFPCLCTLYPLLRISFSELTNFYPSQKSKTSSLSIKPSRRSSVSQSNLYILLVQCPSGFFAHRHPGIWHALVSNGSSVGFYMRREWGVRDSASHFQDMNVIWNIVPLTHSHPIKNLAYPSAIPSFSLSLSQLFLLS